MGSTSGLLGASSWEDGSSSELGLDSRVMPPPLDMQQLHRSMRDLSARPASAAAVSARSTVGNDRPLNCAYRRLCGNSFLMAYEQSILPQVTFEREMEEMESANAGHSFFLTQTRSSPTTITADTPRTVSPSLPLSVCVCCVCLLVYFVRGFAVLGVSSLDAPHRKLVTS